MNHHNDVISIQEADFDVSQHYTQLTRLQPDQTGAVVMFIGLVRDLHDSAVEAMELEHYPGMTEVCLQHIVDRARVRWSVLGVHLVHRVGRLQRHDQIVLLGVVCAHRKDAFAASEFIIDYLKQDAPLWKAEITTTGKHWVVAKPSDRQADKRWKP